MEEFWDEVDGGRAELQVNIVNLGEIFYLVAKMRSEKQAEALCKDLSLRLNVSSAPDDLVMAAARLKGKYKIAYADAFAAATAMEQKLPLITGGLELQALEADGVLDLVWVGK